MFKHGSIYIALLIAMLLLSSCIPQWRSRLAWLEQERWSKYDRLAFVNKSPWTTFNRAEVLGLKSSSKVSLGVNASWLSGYYIAARKEVLREMKTETNNLLEFSPRFVEDKNSPGEYLRVKGEPPFPLTHQTFVVNPDLKNNGGFWPTGVEASEMAYRSMNILPPDKTQVLFDLDDHISFNEYIIIELSILPIIAEAKPEDERIIPCINQLLGQLLLRGASLLRDDGETILSERSVILSADINQTFNNNAFKRHKKGSLIAAPSVVRILFKRQLKGKSWLRENERKIKLMLSLPKGAVDSCAINPATGLEFHLNFEFDLMKMKIVGPSGV